MFIAWKISLMACGLMSKSIVTYYHFIAVTGEPLNTFYLVGCSISSICMPEKQLAIVVEPLRIESWDCLLPRYGRLLWTDVSGEETSPFDSLAGSVLRV